MKRTLISDFTAKDVYRSLDPSGKSLCLWRLAGCGLMLFGRYSPVDRKLFREEKVDGAVLVGTPYKGGNSDVCYAFVQVFCLLPLVPCGCYRMGHPESDLGRETVLLGRERWKLAEVVRIYLYSWLEVAFGLGMLLFWMREE